MEVICIGEALIDFTQTQINTYVANPGGAPANVAVEIARNNIETGMIATLGDDDFGRLMVDTFKDNNVNLITDKLLSDCTTTLAFVTVHDDGERTFTFVRKPGADIMLRKDSFDKSIINECKLLHAGSIGLSDNPAADTILDTMKLAGQYGKIVSFDVNHRGMLWDTSEHAVGQYMKAFELSDIVKISDEETWIISGDEFNETVISKFMEEKKITVLIETLGANGAKVYLNKKNESLVCIQAEGRNVKAIDATGAGDSFFGAFISNIIESGVTSIDMMTPEIVENALNYANIAGSLCVQKKGGIPALPYKNDIEAFI